MDTLSFKKITKPVGWVVGICAVALIAGWAAFKNNPQGFYHYTIGNPCPTRVHSFITVYLSVVGIACALSMACAIACLIAKELPIFRRAKDNIQSLIRHYTVAFVGFMLAALLYLPIQGVFVMVPSEPCKTSQSLKP